MLWLAQQAPGLDEPWNYLTNYGILAMVLILIATGKFIVLRRELDAANEAATRARAERDAERQARTDLEQIVRDKYVPALEASRTTGEMTLKFLQSAGLGK